jgi:hypothetical protein
MYRIRSADGIESVFNSLEEFTTAVRRGDVTPSCEIFHLRANRWLDVKSHPHYRLAITQGGNGAAAPAAVGAPPAPSASPAAPRPVAPAPRSAAPQTTIRPQLQASPAPAAPAAPVAPPPRPQKSRELTFVEVPGVPLPPSAHRNATTIPAQRPAPKPAPAPAPRPEPQEDFLVMDGGIESPVRTSHGVKIVGDDLDLLFDKPLSDSAPAPAPKAEPARPQGFAPTELPAVESLPIEPVAPVPPAPRPVAPRAPAATPGATTIGRIPAPEPKAPEPKLPEPKVPEAPVAKAPAISGQTPAVRTPAREQAPEARPSAPRPKVSEPRLPAVTPPAAAAAPAAPIAPAEPRPEPVVAQAAPLAPAAPAPVPSLPAVEAIDLSTAPHAPMAPTAIPVQAPARSRLPLVVGGLAAVLVAGALLVLRPWQGGNPSGSPESTDTSSQAATLAASGSAPSPSASPESGAPPASSEPAAPAPSPRSASAAGTAANAPSFGADASTPAPKPAAPVEEREPEEQIIAVAKPNLRADFSVPVANLDVNTASSRTAAVAALPPSELAMHLEAAERAAQQELAARLGSAGFRAVLNPARLGSASGLEDVRESWNAGADALRQYRARIARIEKVYEDSVLASQRAERWPPSEMRAWAARKSLAEPGETSQLTDLMVTQVNEALELLASVQGQYEVRSGGIVFKSPAVTSRYTAIRTWVEQRMTNWAATPESARPHTVTVLLRALGDGLPPAR